MGNDVNLTSSVFIKTPLEIDATGEIATVSGGSHDFAGSHGSLTIIGLVEISGTNDYSGGTTVGNVGTLQGASANAFSANSIYTLDSSGSLALGGFDQTIGGLQGTGGVDNDSMSGMPQDATLTIDSTSTATPSRSCWVLITGSRLTSSSD